VTATWRDYFDTLPHQSPLHSYQAGLYVDSLGAAIDLSRRDRILDFGCGFGFAAALLAQRVAEIWWWEPSANMRSVAQRNLAECRNARFCDLSKGWIAELQRERGACSFNAILVNSVVQYMVAEQLSDWLRGWAAMLANDGKVVLSDLITPDHKTASDVMDLFRFGIRMGCPLRAGSDALGGAAHYWRTARATPLTCISRQELGVQAAAAGLNMTCLPANLTHFRTRWTAVLCRSRLHR
jgi:SAM-dependent methyltransferase